MTMPAYGSSQSLRLKKKEIYSGATIFQLIGISEQEIGKENLYDEIKSSALTFFVPELADGKEKKKTCRNKYLQQGHSRRICCKK